jgi:hypothetical protein
MALFRLTFFYEQDENGWSESIHSSSNRLDSLIGQVDVYSVNRMAFTAAGTSLTHVRISDDQVFRDVLLDPITLPRRGQYKSVNSKSDSPFTALDLRLSAAPTVQRSMFVRGIPDNQVDGIFPAFEANFATKYNAWVAILSQGGFSIKNKDRSQLKQPINTISPAGVVNMTSPIPGLANLSTVQVLGIPRSQIPKRTFTVVNFIDGSNFSLRGYAGASIAGRGFFRLVNYVLLPITQAATDFVTERRIGRPFGQQRGRRAIVR